MNEDSCDINDVTRAASDLVAFGCQIGATQLYDSFSQLRFGEIVSSYANEIIRAVDEGVISAKQGLQILRNEYSELSTKSMFYFQNGVSIAAGSLQLQAGALVISASRGRDSVKGAALVAHGINNIYEGVGNIYVGPEKPSILGPIRMAYQKIFGLENGNLAYYTFDFYLSINGMMNLVRKPDTVQLFNKDPINYERGYKQMGSLALTLEAFADSSTLSTIIKESIPAKLSADRFINDESKMNVEKNSNNKTPQETKKTVLQP
ncbi:DUF4225 domain-containing protein [Pseudomonas sp. A34-9]|uniref:DUF4225 domain-containing protein n=1 Tax=Pseudomonas sp. A34-9 TaxID=3034675 RepID=UPI00240D9D93|nr:DUF4225 domain-containing protein [Pseudomonas sp. A34-9]